MNNLSIHIGKRIRYYRKAQNLTISQLADMICKSKSSISKYENAEVSIDIETLSAISNALNIPLSQLIDYSESSASSSFNHLEGFFHNTNLFYMYNTFFNKKIIQSVLIIKPSSNDEADCYFDIKNTDDYYNCGCLYHGHMTSSYTHVNFHLSNEINAADEISLFFNNLFYNTNTTTGLISSISEHLIVPCAGKTILSKIPIKSLAQLNELFQFTTNEQKYLRSNNMLVIERGDSASEK